MGYKVKIISLTKAWRGNEFIIPMIESIYPYMYKLIFLVSNRSWDGETGGNCKEIIENWKKNNDKEDKIIINCADIINQTKQYERLKTIAKGYPHDWELIIDTDEIYSRYDIEKLIEHAIITKCDALMVNMFTYIKDVHYRIDPPEPCKPVAMVRAKVPIDGIRGSGIRNKEIAPVYMHHFTGVRDDMTEISTKLELSNAADGNRPVKDWMSKIWDRLPHGENLHWTAGCEHYWKRILVINDKDLPEVLFQ